MSKTSPLTDISLTIFLGSVVTSSGSLVLFGDPARLLFLLLLGLEVEEVEPLRGALLLSTGADSFFLSNEPDRLLLLLLGEVTVKAETRAVLKESVV